MRSLVEQPGDHQRENLELSWRELRKPRAACHYLTALPPILGGARQRLDGLAYHCFRHADVSKTNLEA